MERPEAGGWEQRYLGPCLLGRVEGHRHAEQAGCSPVPEGFRHDGKERKQGATGRKGP